MLDFQGCCTFQLVIFFFRKNEHVHKNVKKKKKSARQQIYIELQNNLRSSGARAHI